MMVGVYFLFFVALVLIVAGKRIVALFFSIAALLLGLAMLIHHATGPLKILL